MRRPLLAAAAAAALALAGCGADEGAGLGGRDGALAPLREPGTVLLMRHAITEPTTDRPERVGDCGQQRNLTDEGREQARAIGRALRDGGVRIAFVLASPLCRTLETARLAFGRASPDRRLLNLSTESTDAQAQRRTAGLERLLRTAPDGTVLVTHTANIGEATGESLLEGELLAFRDGRLVARVGAEELLGK